MNNTEKLENHVILRSIKSNIIILIINYMNHKHTPVYSSGVESCSVSVSVAY